MALCIEGTILPHGNHGTSPQYQCCFGHVFGQVGKRPARHALAQPDAFVRGRPYDVQVLDIPGQQPDAVAIEGGAGASFDSQWHLDVITASRQGPGRGGRGQAAEFQHVGALLAGIDLAHHAVSACRRGSADQLLELASRRRTQAVRVARSFATHERDEPIPDDEFDPEMMEVILQRGPAAKAGFNGIGCDQNAASEYRHGNFLSGPLPSAGNARSLIFPADTKCLKVYDKKNSV